MVEVQRSADRDCRELQWITYFRRPIEHHTLLYLLVIEPVLVLRLRLDVIRASHGMIQL